jgi:hypothetical protein
MVNFDKILSNISVIDSVVVVVVGTTVATDDVADEDDDDADCVTTIGALSVPSCGCN